MTSAICEPAPGAVLSPHDDEVTLRGYAWSGGGRAIMRVDVSADGGVSWKPAALQPLQYPGSGAAGTPAWAWTLWEATLPLPAGAAAAGEVSLLCKATDSACNAQPESAVGIWNIRGLANNSWHRVRVRGADDG